MRPLTSDVHRRPVVVVERAPDSVIAVDSDRISHVHLLRCPAHVVDVLLEWELWRVRTDYDESLIAVFVGPGPHIGKRAQPVDTRVGPEIDEHDFPAQAGWRERWGVEPLRRPAQRGNRALISLRQ